MRAARWVCPGVAVIIVLLPAPGGVAGGVTAIDWERRYQAVGAQVSGSQDFIVMRDGEAAAEAISAQGYFVYLVPGRIDWRRPWTEQLRGARPAGPVVVSPSEWGSNLVAASFEFELPWFRSGRYTSLICDLGCDRKLGDIYPTEITVVGSAAEARMLPRLRDLRRDASGSISGLRNELLGELRVGATRSAERVNSIRTAAEESLTAQGRQIAALRTELDDMKGLVAVVAWTGLGALAACAVLALRLIRRRRMAAIIGSASFGTEEEELRPTG